MIEGKGFNNDPAIVFSPPLIKGVDYTIMSSTDTKITLKRLKTKKWREAPGALLVVSLDTGAAHGAISFAFGNGIPVATILPDPTVLASERLVYASHTPRLVVRGAGFALDGTELTLSPTPRSAYEVESIEAFEMVLSLNAGKKWANPEVTGSLTLRETATSAASPSLRELASHQRTDNFAFRIYLGIPQPRARNRSS